MATHAVAIFFSFRCKMKNTEVSTTKVRTAKRGRIALVAFLLFASLLLMNILRLDFFAYQDYRDKTFDQITTTSSLRAERGNIYDANMNVLATTKTTWRIFISTKEVKAYQKKEPSKDYARIIAEGLSQILGLNYDSLYKKIANSSVLDVTIKKSATEDEYRNVLEFIEKEKLENLIFTEAQTARYYPNETLAAHILGFTGSDNQGLYGLEYSYDEILAGKNGYYLYAKDANGKAMPGAFSTIVPAEDGNSIITTIDSYIQAELESQLELIRVNHNVTNRVCGIVMDTKTGAILAMATSSPFDPNSPYVLDSVSQKKLKDSGLDESSEEYKALKNELMQIMWSNKAVTETYEPGSTFKIVTVAAALDSGSASMSDTFSCPGYHMVGGWRIRCHKTTGHGSNFTLAYGLQMSCNPTMMTIAERIGSEKFYSYVEKFGYLEKTGIDLPSEGSTIFHDPDNIGSTELATASFGQRFKVTIINQLTAIAAVANGGYLVEPYLVDRVVDSNGNVVSEHGTVVKRQVISTEVASEIAKVLEEGVSGDGGAKNAYVEGYSVAAKTGTSQKFDILDENGNSYLRIGSTVAFAPSDESGIAVIIVVDEPQSQVKYGSTVAAPYVSRLLTKVLPYLEYNSNGTNDTVRVNDYVGMNVNSATAELKSNGMNYKIVGDGNVVLSQFPVAGMDITASLSTVYIITKDITHELVTVPQLTGLSASQANSLATNAGLNILITGVKDTSSPNLTVVSQSLPPGTAVPRGYIIELQLLRTDFED